MATNGFFEPEDWRVASRKVREETQKHSLVREMRSLVRLGSKNGRRRVSVPVGPSATSLAQRVTVKVRFHQTNSSPAALLAARQAGCSKAALPAFLARYQARLHLAHIGYIERPGAGKNGERGELYGSARTVDREKVLEPMEGEEHIFRFVLSPENGHALKMKSYVRDYMKRVESQLGQRLHWAAVSHYDTDHPHAHIVVRGIDKRGQKVRLSRSFVSYEARRVASELATELLGPRSERERGQEYEREASAEGYTQLDRQLERSAKDGYILEPDATRDPLLARALRQRLNWLEQTGRAQKLVHPKTGKRCWKLAPQMKRGLRNLECRNGNLERMQRVCKVPPERWRIIDADEPLEEAREELEKGLKGVVLWKGHDETGRSSVIVETVGGSAYHLPISKRVTEELAAGMVLDMKKAVDKDDKISQMADKNDGVFDCSSFSEEARAAYRRRLGQLEKMSVATSDGKDRWRVEPGFRKKVTVNGPQSYWQMLSVRGNPQPLEGQAKFCGPVWVDGVQDSALGVTGFGRKVREARKEREAYLRQLGLSPSSYRLKSKLLDKQAEAIAERIAEGHKRNLVPAQQMRSGVVTLHRELNGEVFAEIADERRFTVVAASRRIQSLEGRTVQLQVERSGRVNNRKSSRQKGLGR